MSTAGFVMTTSINSDNYFCSSLTNNSDELLENFMFCFSVLAPTKVIENCSIVESSGGYTELCHSKEFVLKPGEEDTQIPHESDEMYYVLDGDGFLKIKSDEKFYKKLENFNIKIISPRISIDRFFEQNNEKIIIDELIELSNPDISKKSIFIFPEGALTGINLNNLIHFKEIFLNKFSDKHTIIMGINTEKIENNSLKIYNSMVVLDNELNLLYEYNKNKLVPFGEFLPLEKYLGKIGLKKVTQGYQSFSSGNSRELIFIDDKKFNFIPLICYEIIYSGKIYPILDDTSFIINISEDGWFGNSIGPYQHFSHSIFRAIEEGKNVIRASNNGISAFIDSNGIIVNKKESTEKGVIEVNNYKDLKKTLFSKYGNKIFFYFIIFYISLFFLIYKKES